MWCMGDGGCRYRERQRDTGHGGCCTSHAAADQTTDKNSTMSSAHAYPGSAPDADRVILQHHAVRLDVIRERLRKHGRVGRCEMMAVYKSNKCRDLTGDAIYVGAAGLGDDLNHGHSGSTLTTNGHSTTLHHTAIDRA
jgi:hypothetical protein